MTDLPRPDVKVTSGATTDAQTVEVTISRDGKDKSYTGSHPYSRDDAIKGAVEQILSDGYTAEWLPGKK